MVILGSGELSTSGVKSLGGSSALEILGISQFGELLSFFLGLVEIVVDALDLGIVVLALSFLESNGVSQSVDLILVSGLLLSVLCKFILKVVGVLPKAVSLVTLDSNFSLESHTLLLSSADLVPDGSYLSLVFVVRSVLLVQQESEVLDLLSEGVDGDNVLVMSVVIVVVLHQLLVLNMPVLLLNGVELVSQSQVVLVSLLDLKDFGFKLRDQQVLLVRSEMDGVVVLKKREGLEFEKFGFRRFHFLMKKFM